MSADYSNIQTQPHTLKGLAVASLVLGIISIPTLGLLVVGAITALVLGIIALSKIKKEPAVYGGRGMAIAGIITSVVSLLIVAGLAILVSVMMPRWRESLVTARESIAIQTLSSIHRSQAQYYGIKQRFGTLEELNEAKLIDSNFANGAPLSGYVFTSAAEVTQDKYCVQATRQEPSTASRDFNVTEDGSIRFVESKTPNPVPCGEGAPLSAAGDQ